MPKDNDNSSDSELEEINVDFEFSTPSEIDFHGLKTLLKQTFSTDVEHIKDSDVADYIIKEAIGNVVKVEGNDDPYALCCILDSNHASTKPIIQFLSEKAKDIKEYFDDRCGIVINDRLINMPPQLAPPLFDMLLQENDVEYKYLVFISKLYHEVESQLSDDEEQVKPKKKQKKDVFYFQAEDEFFESYSCFKSDYKLSKQQSSDSRRVFQENGIEPFRRIIVVPFDKMTLVLEKFKKVLI